MNETTTDAPVRVGDFFYSSWGYDQTNIDYYKVVGLTPKGVKVQEWTSQVLRDSLQGSEVVPGFEPRKGCWVNTPDGGSFYDREREAPIQTKRLQRDSQGRPRLAWTSFADLYLWDCKGHFETDPMFGH